MKVISYLELEGHGRGIIMEVTRPLLLGSFYLVKWPVNPNILAASVNTYSKFKPKNKFVFEQFIWLNFLISDALFSEIQPPLFHQD